MVAAAINNNRLKREQCDRTKHDSSFSHWKILIGPSDWEYFSKGKEGSTRYRIHNLPQKSGPGVYELGVAVSSTGLGRQIYKLATDPRRVVVVYLGKTENVRARLQSYGRNGAHLGTSNGCCSDDSSLQMGMSLFQEIFSQGLPIVYRWAPMQSKEDALKTEAQLLTTFDYAWNTSSNGIRRPDDILQMLNKIASGTKTFSDVAKLLLPFTQRKVGIPIKSCKLPLTDDKSDKEDTSSYNFLSRVFKFNRSRPRIVQDTTTTTGITLQEENAIICGVMLADGSICTRPPVEKRVRCPEHKGMRRTKNVSTAKPIRRTKSESCKLPLADDKLDEADTGSYNSLSRVFTFNRSRPRIAQDTTATAGITLQEENAIICGVMLADGSICTRPPVEKRVRCPEHKGMRRTKNVSTAKPIRRNKSESESIVSNAYMYQNVGHDVEVTPQTVVQGAVDDVSITNICGIILDDGSTCRRQPVKGRKRCHEHKGKRISASGLVNQK